MPTDQDTLNTNTTKNILTEQDPTSNTPATADTEGETEESDKAIEREESSSKHRTKEAQHKPSTPQNKNLVCTGKRNEKKNFRQHKKTPAKSTFRA